ncbi:MAG: hypothetical protein EA403_11230 [Spirochaetaceae bacterium]|nr:MAG: hypothetical protein EA403_11230 [Spirochaetaceae bacterium]
MMRQPFFAQVAFLLVFGALAAVSLSGQEPLLRTLNRYGTTSGFEHRILLDSGSTRALAAAGHGRAGEFVALGFSTPQLVAGPVTVNGLIREMNRPTRYTADSTVYREETGLRLETALEPVRRYGLQVRPWGAAPALLVVMQDERPELVGAHGSFTRGALTLAATVVRAFPDGERLDESWYTEYPRFPGGTVEQAALELTVRSGRSGASAAGFLSGGGLVAAAPGGRVRLEHRGTVVRAAVVGSWVGREYAQTDGRFSRDERYTGGTTRVGRTRGFYAQAAAGERVGRAPLRDERVGTVRRDQRLAVGVAEHGRGRLRLSSAVAGGWVSTRDDRGRWVCTRTVEAIGGIRVGAARARVRLERRERDGIADRDRGEVVMGYRGRTFFGEGRMLVDAAAHGVPEFGGRLEMGVRGGGFELSGRVATIDSVTAYELVEDGRVPFSFSLSLTTRHRSSRPRAAPPVPDGSQTR